MDQNKDFSLVLWDVPLATYPSLTTDFLLMRVLTYGTLALICLAQKRFGDHMLRSTFELLKQSAMSSRRYHYLRTYFFA